MDWTAILSFIQPKLFILIIFLYCLGLFLKKIPIFKAEWLIPIILLGVSLFITVIYLGIVIEGKFTAVVIVTAIIQSVIIAAIAVFGNEIIKQLTKKRKLDK
ncbi:phage holin family protein [Vallitalea guaymasensis]|uniref:phage holin family protein n=1 Tax=Vallitalea guaymasensis TaxID=1185412 RepID=UPI0023534CF0|nr:phage holin family protein [Vallitalea guaymasensis]